MRVGNVRIVPLYSGQSYLEVPLVEGIFSLGLTWVLTPFPKTVLDESINQGLVCAYMHSIARTQKILTFMS